MHSGDTLTLDSLRLAHGQALLSGQGRLGLTAKQPFTFSGELKHFDLSAFLQAPRSDLNARLELAGELAPQTSGTLGFTIDKSQLASLAVSGGGQIAFSGLNQVRGKAEVRLGDNHLSAWGSYGVPNEALELSLAAPALAQLGPGFGGTLNAHAALAGSPANPEITFEAKGSQLILPGEHHLVQSQRQRQPAG